MVPAVHRDTLRASDVPPRIEDLSDRVQKLARVCLQEYQGLCQRYSIGASDPELMEVFLFSKKEVELLNQMSSDEKALYHRICEASIAVICPNAYRCAVQASQSTAILKKFSDVVQVPKDGNCGLHAFAYSYVDQMNANDADRLKDVVLKLGPINAASDEAVVLDRLNKGVYSTSDVDFMRALAKVLRKIGHHGIPEYYAAQIAEMGDSPEVQSIMSNLIPLKDGEWVDHEGLMCLGRMLGKEVCVVREMSDGSHVAVGCKKDPHIVIYHSANHFTALLPVVH
jgi:hypothetical protein